jgi:hypothetical protein
LRAKSLLVVAACAACSALGLGATPTSAASWSTQMDLTIHNETHHATVSWSTRAGDGASYCWDDGTLGHGLNDNEVVAPHSSRTYRTYKTSSSSSKCGYDSGYRYLKVEYRCTDCQPDSGKPLRPKPDCLIKPCQWRPSRPIGDKPETQSGSTS